MIRVFLIKIGSSTVNRATQLVSVFCPSGPNHHSAKKGLILTMKLWKMKKSCDFDHEIMNLVEKNVGTPAILSRTLLSVQQN
jgi:hypothetical protein